MLQHFGKYVSLIFNMMMMLIRQRPVAMISALAILFVSANLDALGLLLMALPFASLPEGESSVELLLGDAEFRIKVGLCFGGAILMFLAGAITVVLSMSLTVATGRRTALHIGERVTNLLTSGQIVEIAVLERALLKCGGIEILYRRSIRSLVRVSFLLPRIIGFALTAMVGLGAILWIDPWFGLFAIIGLSAVSAPLYKMNRGVLKKVPVMEKTMRKSQLELNNLIISGQTSNQIFDSNADFSTSLSIMGHLMTVRYKAGIIRSVFMSVCLVAIGGYLFMFESMDLGMVIPLLLALKIFAGSLQGIARMSVGVSRNLVDATPALIAQTNPPIESTSQPAWPLRINADDEDITLSADVPCGVYSTGLYPSISIAKVLARTVDDHHDAIELSIFDPIEHGVETIDEHGGSYSLVETIDSGDATLFVTRKSITTQSKAEKKSDSAQTSAIEEELDLELDMS